MLPDAPAPAGSSYLDQSQWSICFVGLSNGCGSEQKHLTGNCAETWNADHPERAMEGRFVSDPEHRSRTKDTGDHT
jgi:hypothetical protein